MLRLKLSLVVFLSVLLMLVSNISNAKTLAELQQADKVRVKVWVEPEDNIIARQQVDLQIEVATDKWFSGGTQIGRLEIDGAIVLQREKFTVNSSRNEDGKSWTVQLWTLVIYPLRDGVFDVPSIPLQLSIAGDNLESIDGEAFTEALSFIASIPEQQTASDNWIATSRFEVEESFDKNPEELATGDALIRTIKMSADNLPAMMLPEVVVDEIPDIAVYAKPPQLTDKVNRGDYIVQRTQTFIYVFEKAGEYLLPKQSYTWWNLGTQSYESIELDEHKLTVSRIANKDAADEQTLPPPDKNVFAELIQLLKKAVVPVLLVLILLLGVWFAVRRYKANLKDKTVKRERVTEAGLRKQFKQACTRDEAEKALALFYQWLDFYGDENFNGSVRDQLNKMGQAEMLVVFNDLLQSIYTRDKNKAVDLKAFAHQFINEIRKNKHQTLSARLSVDLKLN